MVMAARFSPRRGCRPAAAMESDVLPSGPDVRTSSLGPLVVWRVWQWTPRSSLSMVSDPDSLSSELRRCWSLSVSPGDSSATLECGVELVSC